jgi:peroxiredoxin Q/BCP
METKRRTEVERKTVRRILWLGLACALAWAALALWKEWRPHVPLTLRVGHRAPDFTLSDQEGKRVSLSTLNAQGLVVLAFYPRADTPG